VRKKRTYRFPLDSPRSSIDAMLLAGGEVNTWDEAAGRWITYEPLEPPEREVIAVRVLYRCRSCNRPPAAEVEHYTAANGTEVVRFMGRKYRRVGDDGELSGYTHAALLEPDLGTAPSCDCPEHGPLVIDVAQVRRDVTRSLDVQMRRSRNGEEKATRTVRLSPADDTPAADPPA
jgi:hypothetical protein